MKDLLRSLHNHRLHLRRSPSARVTTTARILATMSKYFEENIRNLICYLSFFNWRDITVIVLINSFTNVHYAHAGVMARGRILHIRPRTTRVFRIFVTSTQLIIREFSRFLG